MTATAILDLERAGFTRDQVEALARLLEAQTVTKADLGGAKADLELRLADVKGDLELKLGEVRAEVELKIAELKTDLELRIAEVRADLRLLEHRMTIKLGGMIGAAVVLAGAFLRLFPGGHP